MKKLFASAMLAIVGLTANAQLTGSGYYRVYNYGSKNYVWVCDNTGSINYVAGSADVGAMQLWPDLERAVSAPASVLYFDSKGNNHWDIRSQSTGIYQIIKRSVEIKSKGTSGGLYFYELSATESGLTVYLTDDGKWSSRVEYTSLGSHGTGSYRRWIVVPIDVNTDNYFGIAPTIHIGDKHYAPFYADFPFSFASAGMKAYYVSKVDGDIAVIKELTSSVIPASTPLLIECSSANQSDNRLNLLTGSHAKPSDNMLDGVYFCNEFRNTSKDAITAFDAQTMRVWNVNAAGKLVLSDKTDLLHSSWFTSDLNPYLNANQSFLPVAAGTPSELRLMTEEEYNNREIAVTSLTISATQISGTVNSAPVQLTVTASPDNATNTSVAWTSTNEAVATVDNQGLVTLNAVGEAVITATANDGSGVTATCKVTVTPVLVGKITLTAESLSLRPGETSQLVATTEPANAANKAVTWTSSNTSVATVSADGVVTAVAGGTAVITVKAADGSEISVTCSVTVVPYAVYDTNHDDSIDTQDVLAIYEYMQTANPSDINPLYDVNRDGHVDTQDVLLIYEQMQEL